MNHHGRRRSAEAEDVSSRDPFLFIVGVARSGTTLLRAMFDSHPKIAIPGESHFIVRMHRERYERDASFDRESFLAYLLQSDRFARWQLPEERVREALTSRRPGTYADAIRTVYAAYAQFRGKPRYGDKTPGYVRRMPLLSHLFPEGRYIHIIRDGRDVALSHLETEWGPNSVEKSAIRWKKRVQKGLAAGQALGPAHYVEVRYEDLIEAPEACLRRLCEFADLEFSEAMLLYFERAEEIVATGRFRHRHSHIFHAPTRGLRDWRRQMSHEDVLTFEQLAGDLLEELGYEKGT